MLRDIRRNGAQPKDTMHKAKVANDIILSALYDVYLFVVYDCLKLGWLNPTL